MKYLILTIMITLLACGKAPEKDQPSIQMTQTVCGIDFLIQDNQVYDSNMEIAPLGIYKVESPTPCTYQVLQGSVVLLGYPIN